MSLQEAIISAQDHYLKFGDVVAIEETELPINLGRGIRVKFSNLNDGLTTNEVDQHFQGFAVLVEILINDK